ncbi:MAG TPA: DUF6600 domain-containing protein, partial [Pyrinomonadaceae bacterium]|nr:DUF6600 domain-containing protein [Pyrinomonadaceae bacterium]
MNRVKAWPHLAIVAAVCGLLGWGAAALWLRNEPKAEALTVPRAARVERVDGEAGLYRGLAAHQENVQPDAQWAELTPNTPVTEGDRIYVRDNSEASVAFTGRNFARLDPDTALDVLSLTDERTQLALRGGSAVFNIGALRPGELYEVATPRGAFELREPGFYEVGTNDDGSAWISVLSGLAQVVGLAGSGEIGKGEMLTLLGQTAADIALSRLSPDYAGGLLDDYYGYQYPDAYDGRYRDYNAYLNDPYYYDPYNRYASYRYVSDYVPGVYELDRYGQWQDVSGYGSVWRPNVDAGWAPYREGYWTVDDPYGLTWVSNEPWGYAPYHYGRWANIDNQWYWVPEGANTQPAYSPALVAFLPLAGANQIAWVPLAPGDPYATPYYDANWQPHYHGDGYAVPQQVVNLGVPGAVTVVPVEYFNRPIDADVLVAADPRLLGESRPVLEPFSVALLRQAALQTTNTRRRVDIPPGIAKKLDETYVYTSARPYAPPFLEGKTRPGRAEVVGDKQKQQKLQFKDERRADTAAQPNTGRPQGAGRGRGLTRATESPQRQPQGAASESRPGRGNQEERRQAREVERQNRAAQDAALSEQRAAAARAEQQNALRRAERQRPQGARVAMPPQQHQQPNRAPRGRAA